jgi:SAM-dependent MidA family methyltransferase
VVSILRLGRTNLFCRNTLPLNIIEIGGGNGTCAVGILDYLKVSKIRLSEIKLILMDK